MTANPAAQSLTLDALFRRAGVRNAHAVALADPPNRARVTGGAPRTLTFAQADRAISAFAATLQRLGLHAGTAVGLQLPNTVESVVAFLGTLRAGMVPALLPLLWRRQDMIAALGSAGAKAIATTGRIGDCRHADLAMDVAAALFPIRQIGAFGEDLPDGVVPLDGIFTATGSAPPARTGAAAQVGIITFGTAAESAAPVPHDHAQLLAGGAALGLASGFAADRPVLSTIPLGSFAGLAVTLMPWLLTGGTLHLHHGFDADAFTVQASALGSGVVAVPGPALPALARDVGPSNTIVALWRAPLGGAALMPVRNVVDIVCLGDTTLSARARGDDGLPDQAIVEAAARIVSPGDIHVGAYKFSQRALDDAVAAIDPAAMIAALPDAVLGQRLAGHATNGAHMETELLRRGVNPLVAGAFRARIAGPACPA